MDWLLDVFATWLYGLKVIAITLAVIMFISGLDDFFIDVVYWVRRIKRKLSVYRRYQFIQRGCFVHGFDDIPF
ncbi:hypothetical protein, partial [Escherichia coli]|uniref:hypothetical protein n=1 Tax=Escherichia coli TaxID=562 RepID=UPI0024906D4D